MKHIEVVAGIIKDGDKIFATQRGYGEFKDGWEFPGGKMEPGETPQQALARELKEELAIDVNVGNFLCTVDYDYPTFHLTMHCFYCSVIGGELTLLEHEAAKWLKTTELHSVNWLPADIEVVAALERNL
jgi:8-oxo-dGTP diphosphatase